MPVETSERADPEKDVSEQNNEGALCLVLAVNSKMQERNNKVLR